MRTREFLALMKGDRVIVYGTDFYNERGVIISDDDRERTIRFDTWLDVCSSPRPKSLAT